MKALLHNTETGVFYQSARRWTKNQKKAHDFVDDDVAFRMARKLGLQNIEIVYVTEDGTRFGETRVVIAP
jgi:hypothetical protein